MKRRETASRPTRRKAIFFELLVSLVALLLFVLLTYLSLESVKSGVFTSEEIKLHSQLIDRSLAEAKHHKPLAMTRAERDRTVAYLFEDESLGVVRRSQAGGEPDGE